MIERFVKFIFFGNYFVGLLGIVLSIETVMQLQLPFNSMIYYVLLFSGTVMYYTYAYSGVLQSSSTNNLRSEWYRQHHGFVRYSQWFLLLLCIILGIFMLITNFRNIIDLPLHYWVIVIVIFLSSVLYYGLLPKSIFKLNLRNTGWLKAFVIGFVWAACVGLLPIVVLRAEGKWFVLDPVLMLVLFIKNWMFCTVNAMMFDFKDYADDSNKQLQTFVVRFGLNRTISYVLIPLIVIGIGCALAFMHYRRLEILPALILLLPFFLLLIVSYSMYRQKSIFYYLIVIDGLVMVKGLCGILAVPFIYH